MRRGGGAARGFADGACAVCGEVDRCVGCDDRREDPAMYGDGCREGERREG